MASSAFEELTIGIELFEKGAETSRRARTGLVRINRVQCIVENLMANVFGLQGILKKLKEKASLALLHHCNGIGSSALNTQEGRAAELALFGVQTRLPVNKTSFPPGHIQQPEVMPPHQTALALPFEEANSTLMADVHPSLFQYMSTPSQAGLCVESPAQPAPDSSLPFWDQPAANGFVGPSWNTNGPNDFQQFLEETSFTPAAAPDTWGSSNLQDLSMVINSDNDLDEQWLTFMRENGMGF